MSFTDALKELDNGQFVDDLSRALPKLIQDCQAGNAAGELTIKLKIKPRSGTQVDVMPSYKVVAPPLRKPDPTIMFVDEAGDLSLYAPVSSHGKQQNLRAVPLAPPGARKTIVMKIDKTPKGEEAPPPADNPKEEPSA